MIDDKLKDTEDAVNLSIREETVATTMNRKRKIPSRETNGNKRFKLSNHISPSAAVLSQFYAYT
jgi:hypothetical protein